MFDIGVNLTSSQFSRDRDEVIARARAAGVTGMLLTGTNLHESAQAQQLAHGYSGCWSTAGVHPHDSRSWTESAAAAVYELAREPEVVAIGECGLDFNPTFQRLRSKRRRLAPSWRSLRNCRCRYFCTAAMRTTVSWPC